MKTLITLVVLILNVSCAMADVYSEGLRKMMDAGVFAVSPDNLKLPALSDGQPLIKADVFDNMVEIIAPYYRDNMTETEFTQMVDFQMQPEIIAIQKSLLGKLDDLGVVIEGMQDKIMVVAQGGKADPIAEKDADPRLKEKIHRYLDVMDTKNTVTASMKSVRQMLMSHAENNPMSEHMMAVYDRITGYVADNISAVLTNIYIDNATEKSLDVCLTISDQPFYPAMKKANEAMLEDMSNIISKIIPEKKQ